MKIVRWMILIIGSSVKTACASNAGKSDSGISDGTQPIFLECSDGRAKCVSAANKICGFRGFGEIDRTQDAHMTVSGRLDAQTDGRHVYRVTL